METTQKNPRLQHQAGLYTRFSLSGFAAQLLSAFCISQHRGESLCQRREHKPGCLAPDFLLKPEAQVSLLLTTWTLFIPSLEDGVQC